MARTRVAAKAASTEAAAVWVDPAQLVPWVGNPRKNDGNVARVAASIERFGFGAPIVARLANKEIIAGHTRWKAARSLKLAQVPVRYLDVSEQEAHLLALADNRLNELSPWDEGALVELSEEFGSDDMLLAGWASTELDALGADPAADAQDPEKGSYTRDIKAPIYEPKGPPPPVSALCERSKVTALVQRIDAAKLPQEIAEFLRFAAERHTRFDYGSIAEFYAHAPANTQRLMQDSALVIVDFDRAIENGFVRLSKRLGELVEIEKGASPDDA